MTGGSGRWSVYRLLKTPMQGYLAFWFGPGFVHILQFVSHVLCVLLFYFLLKRINWSTAASLAAGMLFCAFPWMSEAVYWWPAAAAIWATILLLGAAHCLISWNDGHLNRWFVAYAGLVFLSLAMYELWLGGFIFFAVLDWYCRAQASRNPEAATRETPRKARESIWRYGKIAAPFLVYVVLYWIAPSADASDRVDLPLARIPFSISMVHLRALQWPIDTQWRWTFLNAGAAFHSGAGLVWLAIEIVVLLLLGYAWIRKFPQADLTPQGVPLWHSLLLGWSIFFGSRIALVFQGFIARYDTRENYAASMGIAVAVVALVASLLRSRIGGRWVQVTAGAAILALVFVLGWTSAGIGVHYVMTSEAEAETIREIGQWISAEPAEWSGRAIVVAADASAISHGTIELSYFNEHDGYWLDYVVKKRCPNCTVIVTDAAECVGNMRLIALHEPVAQASLGMAAAESENEWWLSPQAILLRWNGQELEREPATCR